MLINQEVQEMLQKGAIQKEEKCQGQFLSSLFVIAKKDSGFRPVINLKALNQYIPYLQKGDYMCKLDLKDAYFSVPLQPESRKFVRFPWGNSLYEFLCLCFGLSAAPRIFTKLMKVPMALLRRLNIRSIIFLDDVLIIAATREEALMARDTLTYVLQSLVFKIEERKAE